MRALTAVNYHALAAERGYQWIGEFPANTHAKTLWRCSHGHEWGTSYNIIRGGHGCPDCASDARLTAADYHALAASRNLEWIGGVVPAIGQSTLWRCPLGHEWGISYANLNYRRHAECPQCARVGSMQKAPADYHALATECGFEWVGEFPLYTKRKTTWRCSFGHRWDATYNSVQKGHGCHKCRNCVNGYRVSKPQIELRALIGGELNYRVGRRAIDIAFPDEKIAIEYDCFYWHNAEKDERRNRAAIKQGWRVLCIKAGRLLPTLDQIAAALQTLRNGTNYTEIVLSDWGGD